ncbi:hypothetical protein HK099_006652 [Clydaea vesicula]|uniref:Bidirectional sugar transporter SWEET n=1 Tax=Clydaea vesicula TaxID=447962 RepID=A0AAD5U5Y8_9FUNG|nr:hypothetical protein HK099_006652 [Clydaea vesicula]
MIGIVCTNEACNIIIKYIIPAIGCLMAHVLFFSPLLTVLRVRKEKNLGPLNPVPYPCNFVGYFLGLFYTFETYPLANTQQRKMMIISFFAGSAFSLLAGGVSIMSLKPINSPFQRVPLGTVAVIIQLLFFASPFTVIFKVIKTRNSASIHAPLCITTIMCSGSWAIYGLIIGDWFVAGPSMASTTMGILQLICRIIFPAKLESSETTVHVEVDPEAPKI